MAFHFHRFGSVGRDFLHDCVCGGPSPRIIGFFTIPRIKIVLKRENQKIPATPPPPGPSQRRRLRRRPAKSFLNCIKSNFYKLSAVHGVQLKRPRQIVYSQSAQPVSHCELNSWTCHLNIIHNLDIMEISHGYHGHTT